MSTTSLIPLFASSGGHGQQHELPNLLTFVGMLFDETVQGFIEQWQGMIFAILVALLIVVVVQIGTRNPQMIPGRLQNFLEIVVDGLNNFILDILGPQGKPYVPYIATLFIYILCMNLSGVIPFGKSPTASVYTTGTLAICTFLYSNWIGLRKNGPLGYLHHLAGSPRQPVEWALVPLNIPIHILGEIAKPVSLALRLFGNVTGEDVLLYAFTFLGISALSFMDSPVGIPFQLPFIFLALLTSTIQALVFALLSTIYILLWLPHEEGH
jgi:F-type H+-transporting ATPase subunit a